MWPEEVPNICVVIFMYRKLILLHETKIQLSIHKSIQFSDRRDGSQKNFSRKKNSDIFRCWNQMHLVETLRQIQTKIDFHKRCIDVLFEFKQKSCKI